MPPRRRFAMAAFVMASACSPSRFGWHEEPDTVDRYRAGFTAAVGSQLVESASLPDVLQRTRQVRVLWLGDHHRSQRLHHEQRNLLRALAGTGRRLLLVLEAIGEQDHAWLDAWLAGTVDMRSLRAGIRRRWPGSWLEDGELDAAYYRDLLAFAAQHDALVRGLEPAPRLPLTERDARIAARVRQLAETHTDRLVVVVLGQAHLLGQGDVIARCGMPNLALGGEPPAALAAAAVDRSPTGLSRSASGLWWFDTLLAARPLQDDG